MSKEAALKLAQEAELDLFVVSDKTDVPIARIVDYGKYKFQQSKKEKTGKKKQSNETKEIKMSYNIDIGDYNTRVNQSIKFLEKDKRVKLNITLRGREIQHVDLAKKLALKFIDDVMEYGTADGSPDKMMGRSVIIYVNPGADKAKIKKKQQELKLLEEQENAKNSSELQNS
jgi:translation initiation factor IF-3